MKKLSILLVFALLLSCGVALAFTEASDPGLKETGSETIAQGVRIYRIVRNPITNTTSTAASMASSEVVIWDLVSDDGVTVNYTTNVGISVSNDAVAGVVVGSIPTADATSPVADLGKGNWGYIQIYGKALAKVDSSAITAGEGLRASATDKLGTGAGHNGINQSGDALGFAYDASSSASTINVFVRAR